MHMYLRDSVNLQNCDSYNSYKALLGKLKPVIKLKSVSRVKKCYCLHEKQEIVVTNILFCVHSFFNREHYYHRHSS